MNYVNAYVDAVNYARSKPKPSPDVSRVPAKDVTGRDVTYQLQGTKLATDLARIRRIYGDSDPEIRELVSAALAGHPHAFTGVRDRLLLHSQPNFKVSGIGGLLTQSHNLSPSAYRQEAARLAHAYNWDRVGKGLDSDDVVAEYVWKVAGKALKDRNEVYRAAHNLFGIGSAERRPESSAARSAFWKGLREHIKAQRFGETSRFGFHPADFSDERLARSIRRLAEREHTLAQVTDPTVPVSGLIGEQYRVPTVVTKTPKGRKVERLLTRDVDVSAEPVENPATRLPTRGKGKPVYDVNRKVINPPKFLPSGLPTRAQQFKRRPTKYGLITDKIAAAVSLPKRLVDAAVDATAGRAARAVGLDPRQHPDLSTEHERTVIDPRTGEEPGVNLWTGNERRRGAPLKAEIVPEHHWSDGLVHNGVYPGTNVVAPSADAAYRERVAVHRALEQRSATSVPASAVSAHIAELKRLAETPDGQAMLGDRLKHYRWIAETLPSKRGQFIRGTNDLEARPDSDVDRRLTALVGPLVRLANAHLVARGKAEPLAGDRGPGGFETTGDDAGDHLHVDTHAGEFELPIVEGLHSPDVDEIENYANPPTTDEMIAAARDRERSLRRLPKAAERTKQKSAAGLLKQALLKLKEKVATDDTPLPLAETVASKTAKTRVPLSKIRQAIADHKADRLSDTSIIARIASDFDLTPKAATKQFENFLRLRRKPEGKSSTKPEPKPKKPVKKKKYSRSERAGFHQAIRENPNEQTHALVYADHLQEQGLETQAAVIRAHTRVNQSSGTHFRNPNNNGYIPASVVGHSVAASRLTTNGKHYIQLYHQSDAALTDGESEPGLIRWTVPTESPDVLLKKLRDEGVHVDDHHFLNPPDETTDKYAAWKATGDWVDRDGIYYGNGRFTPSPAVEAPAEEPRTFTKSKKKKKSLFKALRLIRALSTAGAVV